MDNILKKRLALIKSRAERLKHANPAGRPNHDPPGNPADDSSAGGESNSPARISSSDMYRNTDILPGIRFEDVVSGHEHSVEGSQFHLIRLEGTDIDEGANEISDLFRADKIAPVRGVPPAEDITKAGPDPLGASQEGICFFDIETTGLSSSTYAFLCGLMFLEGERFVVEQLFARDYDEEYGVLKYLRQRFADFHSMVTYNGKTFDIPFIRARMAVNRLEFEETFNHVDLLMSARRVYSGFLENCKLGTVERYLRGEDREGDIPGGEIPEAYHNFVRTGNAEVMERVLYHNRMDLLTLAILYNRLWPGGAGKNGR